MLNDARYSKFLTVLLIILILGILTGVGFLIYNLISGYRADKENEDVMAEFVESISKNDEQNNDSEGNTGEGIELLPGETGRTQNNVSPTKVVTRKPISYNINRVIGIIEIPKTKIKYPIYSEVTVESLNKAVAKQYGTGLNQEGNTVIAGHNTRNGKFFSNNKKLVNGDKISITDDTNKTVTYTIYNMYSTTPEDTSFFVRDTAGAREISLTTCSDDSKERLIIWAKAD